MGECELSTLPAPYPAEVGKLRLEVDQLRADKVALQETLARLLKEVAALREALLGRGAVGTTNLLTTAPEPPGEPISVTPLGNQQNMNNHGVDGQVTDLEPTISSPPQPFNEWTTVVKRGRGKAPVQGHPATNSTPAGRATQKPAPGPAERKPIGVIRKAAIQALSAPSKAAEFESVFFKLPNPRELLSAEPRDRPRLLRAIIQRLDLKTYVSGISVIPGPVIQLVAMKGSIRYIRETLERNGLTAQTTADRFAKPPHSPQSETKALEMTARRLASLCRQSKSRNFQEEALLGATDILRSLVLKEYRRMTRNTTALLGHKGRWYADQEMVDDTHGDPPSDQ